MKLTLAPKKIDTKDLYIMGLNLLVEGKKEDALQVFTQSVKADSENVEAYYHAGNILRELDNVERAEKIHSELLRRPALLPDFREKVKLALVRDCLALKNFQQAEQLITDSLKGNKQIWLKEALLEVYESTENWEKAITLKAEIDKQKGDNAPELIALYYVERGKALMEKNGRAARIQFKEAIKKDPLLPWPYILIADSYFHENRIDDALEFWSRLFDANPAQAYLIFERIEKYYYDAGEYGEVGRIYRRLVDREPNNVDALLALSRYLTKRGDKGEALSYCKKALEINPKDRAAYAEILSQTLSSIDVSDEIKEAVEGMLKMYPAKKRFICKSCRTRTETPHWHCHSCGAWSPYKL
jgi:lipopolysaccharide biosynthesis regulator YciM